MYKVRSETKNIIHIILICQNCGERFENYRTGKNDAAAHVRKTGHTVTGEVAYAYRVEPNDT